MQAKKYIFKLVQGIGILTIIIGIIMFPSQSIKAAKTGISIWANTLVPSLFPFIIGANMIISLKVIDLIGVLIQPISKLIFNVSGKGSLIFAISMVSGYPIGSKLSSKLRINNEISLGEAQRLSSFCSTAGPLFIMGAVGVGMYSSSYLGYIIAIAHYLGAFTIGILVRNFNSDNIENQSAIHTGSFAENIHSVLLDSISNEKKFSLTLSDAIKDSINTILIIGGFVLVFSVLLMILKCIGVIKLITNTIFALLMPFSISKELINAFISGLFEMTIGCNNISLCSCDITTKISLSTFLISFSGISILAQSCNFLSESDINIDFFIICKLLHGIISSFYAYALCNILKTNLQNTVLTSNFYNISLNQDFYYHFYFLGKLLFLICMIFYLIQRKK